MDELGAALEWLDRAEHDLEMARDLLDLGHWDLASFQAQQAAEKALKGVQILRQRTFDKVHDVSWLARRLKAGRDIEDHAAFLTRFYTASRYPDAGGDIPEDDAREAVRRAEEVVKWARTQPS